MSSIFSITPVTGQKTVTTAGTAERLIAYEYLVKSLMVKALKGNTDLIYIGNKDVSSTIGDEVSPGGIRNYTAEIDPDTGKLKPLVLSHFWLDSAVNGEGVSYEYIPV